MSRQNPAMSWRGQNAVERSSADELDAVHQELARAEVLLAAAPGDVDTSSGAIAADLWLAEVETLLHRADRSERAGLLAAAADVRSRLQQSRGCAADESGGKPQLGSDTKGRVPAQVHADVAEAASIYADLGQEHRAAATYVKAALSALREDQVSTALSLAVQGIVTFNAAPTPLSERAEELEAQSEAGATAEANMALALSRLCWEFFDPARAMRFAEIAAGELLGTNELRRWAEATQLHAEACLFSARTAVDLDLDDRVELVRQARRGGEQLRSLGPTGVVRSVTGPRLLAEAWCVRGEPQRALGLLDEALSAAQALPATPGRRRELAAVQLTRARCAHQLGRHEQALAELAAVSSSAFGNGLSDRLAVLELRLQVREASGDLAGALRDSRRVSELVSARHQRQISGFLGQVWGLAAHESRRQALEERQQDLIRTAELDPLTGVANRRGVGRFCAALLREEAISLAVVDVDHFKLVNDRYGHPIGDAVLKRLAQTLVGCVRGVDMLGRWGGEEFVVVLPGTSLEWAAEAAARIRRQVAAIDWSDLLPGRRLTVSVGVAHGRAGEFATILTEADRALYRAKSAGRDQVATTAPGASH